MNLSNLLIHQTTPVVAATLGNNAGIIGAALFAQESGVRPTQARGAYSLGTDE